MKEDIEIEGAELKRAKMTDPHSILAFMFAGDATLTFKSVKSGNHYTFRIQQGDLSESDKSRGRQAPFFVKILKGSDNENDYSYMGMITFRDGKPSFRLTAASARSHLTEDDRRVKAFRWTFEPLINGRMPVGVEVWHEGRCSRCNRKLTDTDSIKRGFGPICYELMGGEIGVEKFALSVVPNPSSHQSAVVADEPVKPVKPTTPKAILAAVNEDAEIAKLAKEMWEKNPNNPANIQPKPPAEPLPVDGKVAEALARSQDGWTVQDAVEALSKRRIVNLNLKSDKVAKKTAALGVSIEPTLSAERESFWPERETGNDPEIIAKVNELKNSNAEMFTSDGIMDDEEAFSFWYHRFATNPNPVED